ncbi:MAG TPA: hypothetical protein VEG60_28280 [Candidatus Binatia bacterium]|nr:hypothetical protein [Candidatus Binatia bacterium]
MAPKQKRVLKFLYLALVFRLLQESLKPAGTTKKATARDEANEFSRIRCPLCKWRPNRSSRWFCGDCDYPEYFAEGCGTAWNTFTTRGRCPGCGHQWRWTICLTCHRWSQHEEWYQDQN